jgi:hypothetical protein
MPRGASQAKRPTPDLRIRIKNGRDGSAALTCTRRDGSQTWQRQAGSLGLVFPAHDLTHYVVETVMGFREGFFGLLAAGWEISDFAAPFPRGPIPYEARATELLVGLMQMEQRHGREWTAADIREEAVRYAAAQKTNTKVSLPEFTDDHLARIRAMRRDVFEKWAAIPPGEALELDFPAQAGTAK